MSVPEVLIISPYFPPSTLAGVHRARHLAKWLPAAGWKPVVLCVHERHHEQRLDVELSSLVPADVEVFKVAAIPSEIARKFGLGDISLRAWFHLRHAALELARRNSVRAVLITGSPYYPMLLASQLRRRFGLPVVLDFQDPWLSGQRATQPLLSKAGATHRVGKWLEPKALRAAAHITSVSERQNLELLARFPWLSIESMSAIPIGADPDDFEVLRKSHVPSSLLGLADGKFVMAYVGTIWPKVIPTLAVLLEAIARIRVRRPEVYRQLKVLFVGTTSNPSDHQTYLVRHIAKRAGVDDIVVEVPQRLPYLEALAITANANVNLIIGSDEPHYNASKVYGLFLAGRPYLSILREDSSAHAVCKLAGGGIALGFSSMAQLQLDVSVVADAIVKLATMPNAVGLVAPGATASFEARAIAREFANIFDRLTGRLAFNQEKIRS